MIKWIKMKKKEIELKNMVYGYLLGIIKNKEDIITTSTALFESLKGKTGDELRTEFIQEIAKLVHEENKK